MTTLAAYALIAVFPACALVLIAGIVSSWRLDARDERYARDLAGVADQPSDRERFEHRRARAQEHAAVAQLRPRGSNVVAFPAACPVRRLADYRDDDGSAA